MKTVFIGDFGAGNTCLYKVVADRETKPSPDPLYDANAVKSGYIIRNNGSWGVGWALDQVANDWEKFQEIRSIRVNVKAVPSDENEQELIHYFRAWHDTLRQEHPQKFSGIDEEYWMIGCPTGEEWKSPQIRERYRQIFLKAGYQNVIVIPESNGAIAFYQETQNIFKRTSAETGLLLIDQGAYSLDVSYFKDGELHSIGSYLGAALVEMMIIEKVLYSPKEKYVKKEYNLPKILESIRKMYEDTGEQGRKFRSYLLLNARTLKEAYFTQIRTGSLKNKQTLTHTVDIGSDDPDEQLVLYVNRQMMQDIMYNESVKSILGARFHQLAPEVQEELGDYTWCQAFQIFLTQKADTICPDFCRACQAGRSPVIILTGGGSLMGIVTSLVAEHYKNAEIDHDYEAVSAIGKGIALWAPAKIEADDFENAFVSLLGETYKDEDGDDIPILIKYFNDAFLDCLKDAVPGFLEEEVASVAHGIMEYMNYNCSSSMIPDRIESHFNSWINNTGVPAMEVSITRHISELKKKINSKFSEMLKVHGFDSEDLLKPNDNVFLSVSRQFLVEVFKVVRDIITAYYRNWPWSDLPDYKQGWFSDKRAKICSEIAELLKDRMEKEQEQTINLIANVFFTQKLIPVGDDEYSFSHYFTLEGVSDMMNLIEARKKELLGKLVLQEYLVE